VLKFRLLLELMRRPMWWVGIGCMILGQLLAGFSFDLATVAIVEPLLSTNLLFALALAAFLSEHRVKWQEIVGAVLVSAALAVFIVVGDPHSSPAPEPNNAVIVAAVCAVAVAVAVLVVVAKRGSLVRESILLATGAGLLFGLQDTSTRATLLAADHHGIASLVVNMWTYIVLVTGVVGVLLAQSAFKTARLDHSLPPIAVAEPVVGIALGVSLLGDVVSVSILGLALESVCLVAMVAGVALIGRSPSLANPCAPVSPAPAEHADSA
jgi:drug/metabolite transporter (DMT)-like permease